MFETIAIVVVRLRQQQTIQTLATLECLLPLLAVSNDASPLGWSQNWSHLLADAANHSGISTFRGLPSLPWAQGVAGSNPAAPTIFLLVNCNELAPGRVLGPPLLPHVGHAFEGSAPIRATRAHQLGLPQEMPATIATSSRRAAGVRAEAREGAES